MTKDQLEKVIMVCLNDLESEFVSESEKNLIRSFIHNLKQNVFDKDQSDQFIKILQGKLEDMNSEPTGAHTHNNEASTEED